VEVFSPGSLVELHKLSGWGYRLSAQRRQGNASTRSTSSPVCSSKAV